MTAEEREEAKAYFQSRLDWKKENRYPYVSAHVVKVYKIALEALNGDVFEGTYEVELEKDDNAVSRQKLKEQMIKYGFHAPDMTVTEFVKDLPPVTPQQKMARWIFVDKAREHGRCPKCGYGDIDLMDGKPHNYCQNCGIRLKIQTESEVKEIRREWRFREESKQKQKMNKDGGTKMTFALDKEIKRCEAIAEEKFNNAVDIMDKIIRKSDIKIAINKAEEYKKRAEEYNQLAEWLKDYKRVLEKLSCSVSREVFEQVMRERDVAIGQLKELGYEFGQKIEPCDVCISRQTILALLNDAQKQGIIQIPLSYFACLVENLPPIVKDGSRNGINKQVALDLIDNAKKQGITKITVLYFMDLVENLPPYKEESEKKNV